MLYEDIEAAHDAKLRLKVLLDQLRQATQSKGDNISIQLCGTFLDKQLVHAALPSIINEIEFRIAEQRKTLEGLGVTVEGPAGIEKND